MARVRLTARTVEAARPPATGRLELFDEGLPGFCIRITANDRRTACVFYRIGARLRRATLGTLPPPQIERALENVARIKTKLQAPHAFSESAFKTIDQSIWDLRVAVLGEEAAAKRSPEDGKRSPVETY